MPLKSARLSLGVPFPLDKFRRYYLKIRAGFLTVGSLIRDLGVPCAVYTIGMANASPKIVVLSFRDRIVYVVTGNSWRIEPASIVLSMDLGPYAPPTLFTGERQVKRCRRYGAARQYYKWQGFRQYPSP